MAGTPAQKATTKQGIRTAAARRWRWRVQPTPTIEATGVSATERQGGENLSVIANLAFWPTPNAMEGGQTSRSGKRKDELLMGGLVRGTQSNGLNAQTANGGQLNPAHSRWLMGYRPHGTSARLRQCHRPASRGGNYLSCQRPLDETSGARHLDFRAAYKSLGWAESLEVLDRWLNPNQYSSTRRGIDRAGNTASMLAVLRAVRSEIANLDYRIGDDRRRSKRKPKSYRMVWPGEATQQSLPTICKRHGVLSTLPAASRPSRSVQHHYEYSEP